VDILRHLLSETPPTSPIDSPRACFDLLEPLDSTFQSTVDRAAAGGFIADRLGYAFLAGYRAALTRLDPKVRRASLCATESAGPHPRAISTRLRQSSDPNFHVLTGEKTFATLASVAETLLVVASVGEKEGRNQLVVARVPAGRAGVVIRDREPLAFAPEIPHARVTFADVRVAPEEVLDGDGYERLLKPFRTIEDVHVTAASLGHIVRVARLYGEPREIVERSLASLSALRELATHDPLDPALHVALAGVLAEAAAVAQRLELGAADEAIRARWARDLPLLGVAGAVRELRREAAHRVFGPQKTPAP
jgi:alkylation response protein AidB-like acyl-CoA dehydrogenase